MGKFEDREQSFEKKFANDQEFQFKINARRNKYLAEWVAKKLHKNEEQTKDYIQEVIKADFQEPGDQDVIKKVKGDLTANGLSTTDDEINKTLLECFERAKQDFS